MSIGPVAHTTAFGRMREIVPKARHAASGAIAICRGTAYRPERSSPATRRIRDIGPHPHNLLQLPAAGLRGDRMLPVTRRNPV